MESHGGNVELLGIEDGVAKLRLEGSCKSCRASSSTLELAVRQALEEAAPGPAGHGRRGGRRGRGRGHRDRAAAPDGQRGPAWPPWTSTRPRRPRGRRRRRRAARGRERRRHAARLPQQCADCGGALDGGALDGGALGARRAGAATSCRRRAARWTTTTCSSSPCRCCARTEEDQGRAVNAELDEAVAGRRRALMVSGPARPGAAEASRSPPRPSAATSADDRAARPPAHAQPLRAPDRLRVRELLGAALGRRGVPPDRQPHALARGLRAAGGALGAVPDPDRARVLHALERHRLRRGALPEPGGRHRERAALRDLGPARRDEPGAARARAGRRGADREPDVRTRRVRDRADRPLLHAGRPGQGVLGGHLGRRRGRGGDRGLLRRPAGGGREPARRRSRSRWPRAGVPGARRERPPPRGRAALDSSTCT